MIKFLNLKISRTSLQKHHWKIIMSNHSLKVDILIKNKTLESKGAEYVKKYIRSPELINPKTKMLPLSNFKNREEMIQGIVDFLTFM